MDIPYNYETEYLPKLCLFECTGGYAENGKMWWIRDRAMSEQDCEDTVLIACMRRWYKEHGFDDI